MNPFLTGEMTLQWSIVAFILYSEIFATLLLLLPWIKPDMWRPIFNSRLVNAIKKFANIIRYSAGFVFILLLTDAIREVRKCTDISEGLESNRLAPADPTIQKRLFHAQRNLYMVGMILILYLVIVRIAELIHHSANLSSAAVASIKEAQSATQSAKVIAEADPHEVVQEIQSQINELEAKLKNVEEDRDIMKTQAEHLQKQYNRVSDELRAKIGGD